MFKHTIYSDKVTINAPKKVVWDFLCDLDNYPQWNPFTFEVNGKVKVGETVELNVRMGKRGDLISNEQVKCADINKTLSWGMTMVHPLLLIAQRDQELIALNDSQCTYQTWDSFKGILTPIVVGIYGNDMQNGFNSVAYALQKEFA